MKIIWSPTARTKTKKILEYIAEDNPDAALTLINQFETKVEELKEHPESGRVLPELKNSQIREIVVNKNYGVIYEINTDITKILTIRHFRQHFRLLNFSSFSETFYVQSGSKLMDKIKSTGYI